MQHIGIIGGTGIYDSPDLEVIAERLPSTPYGDPSGPIVEAEFEGEKVFFLPRHGKNHELLPHEINYRANIFALKSLGVTRCLSISAVGSMREEIAPGHFLMADQIIDFSVRRNQSFLEKGISGYPSLADPFDKEISAALFNAFPGSWKNKSHSTGTYICIEGPHLSSRAESEMFRSWGADIIGMTACPEVRLCCEAQISFMLLAMVSDYDCWKNDYEDVTVSGVLEVLEQSTQEVKSALPALLSVLKDTPRSDSRAESLSSALMIDPKTATFPQEDHSKEVLEVLLR